MKIAIGIVANTEKNPHGELCNALATTTAIPARVIINRNNVASIAPKPANLLISSRAISAIDLPS